MKSLRWRNVSGGIVALAAIVAVVLFVLVYARSGALHGSRFRLFVAAPDANNLRAGSDVWLSGQRVGIVRSIGFNRPAVPAERRVVIEVDVLSAVRPQIRLNSRANLRNAGSVLGEPVVYIETGTISSRVVVPGDTLRAAGNPDLEIAASKVAQSMDKLPALFAGSKEILADAKSSGNRLTKVVGGGIGNGSLSRNLGGLMSKLSGGRGSAARILADTTFRVRITRSMAGLDSLHQLLAAKSDVVGRFRRDSSLVRTVGELRTEVAHLRTMANSTDGTVGRALADSALRTGLDSAFLELTTLFADIKKHPTRYARVF